MPNYGKSSNSISNSKEDYFDMGGGSLFFPKYKIVNNIVQERKRHLIAKVLHNFFLYPLVTQDLL